MAVNYAGEAVRAQQVSRVAERQLVPPHGRVGERVAEWAAGPHGEVQFVAALDEAAREVNDVSLAPAQRLSGADLKDFHRRSSPHGPTSFTGFRE
jgi:hypothetical protein